MESSNLTLINELMEKSRFYYELTMTLDKTTGFIIFIVGLVANTCILFLMKSKKLLSLTISVYLITLAISDTMAILFDNFVIFLDLVNTAEYSIQQETHCRIFYFTFTARLISAWTVVNISLDRFISVYYPRSKQKFLSRKSCIIRVVALIVASFLFNLQYAIIIKQPEDKHYDCYSDAELWYEEVWPSLFTLMYSIIPSVLITTFNSLLIYKTIKSKKNLHKIEPTQTSTTNPAAKKVNQDSSRRLNITVIVICISFVVFTLPANVINIATVKELTWGDEYANPSVLDLEYQKRRLNIVYLTFIRKVFEHLMDLNHCINFFLYVLSSKLFRTEFLLLLKVKKFSLNNTTHHHHHHHRTVAPAGTNNVTCL